jgi:hypothetical protein
VEAKGQSQQLGILGVGVGVVAAARLSVSAWLGTLLLTAESKSETQHLDVGVGVVVAARLRLTPLSVSARLCLLHLE